MKGGYLLTSMWGSRVRLCSDAPPLMQIYHLRSHGFDSGSGPTQNFLLRHTSWALDSYALIFNLPPTSPRGGIDLGRPNHAFRRRLQEILLATIVFSQRFRTSQQPQRLDFRGRAPHSNFTLPSTIALFTTSAADHYPNAPVTN